MGVLIVMRMVCGDDWDPMRLCPTHSYKSDRPGGVRVDNVELVLAKEVHHRIKRWKGERISLCPWGFGCWKAVGVRV